MRTFLLTSPEFEGELEFRYCPEGHLQHFDHRAEMDPVQRAWLLANLPCHINALMQLKQKTRTAKITEKKAEVTFDDFWNKYDHKATSSKKKALARWQRMPLAERLKAYYHINRYFASIPGGVSKKNAETYLNSELWNN